MFDDDTLESKFILKLIKDTNNLEITWNFGTEQITLLSDQRVVGKVYFTFIKEKRFRIYKYTAREYIEIDEYYTTEKVRFEMTDNKGESLFEFDSNSSLADLHYAIRKANSKAKDFMLSFLNDHYSQ